MRWLSFSYVLFLAVAAAVSTASAQDGPDIFITPIPNTPFSGVVNVERSVIQPNSSVLHWKTVREIRRDSHGRIHNEARALMPASSHETPQLLRIHLYDPQTRVSTIIFPREKTFRTQTLSHPPAAFPPGRRYSSTAGDGPQNDFAQQEDLGLREMEGVQVHGILETQTIPAESGANGKEITVKDEYWYSDDLRINLLIKHDDPRTGTITMTVSKITRSEPNAAEFEIPEGYKLASAQRRTDH